jgi:hypothetical protein
LTCSRFPGRVISTATEEFPAGCRKDVGRSLKGGKLRGWRNANHSSIRDSRPTAFWGCARGHRVKREARPAGVAYTSLGYSPRTRGLSDRMTRQGLGTPGVQPGRRPQAACLFSCSGW